MIFDKKSFFFAGLWGFFMGFCVVTTYAQAQENDAQTSITKNVTQSLDIVELAIKHQLDAIRARNAEQAMEQTTANFHTRYNSGKDFLKDIRFESRPLYNHEDYKFLERHEIENGVIQKVEIQERYSDEPVLVIFKLTEDEEGHLLIDSFAIIESSEDDAQPI